MTRVRIRGGYLNIGRRQRPGHPDQGLPVEPEYPEVDPPEEGGEYPDNELPSPPPGIWPPPTIGHPVHPIAPEDEDDPEAGHLPAPPPGSIWPRPPGPVSGLFVVLAHIPEHGWHYIVIDPDAWPKPPVSPEHPIAPGSPTPGHPIAPGQPATPKRA
jgi:hypothetical protein